MLINWRWQLKPAGRGQLEEITPNGRICGGGGGERERERERERGGGGRERERERERKRERERERESDLTQNDAAHY